MAQAAEDETGEDLRLAMVLSLQGSDEACA